MVVLHLWLLPNTAKTLTNNHIEGVDMIIEVRYRAVRWDNHQGGSGMPYVDTILFSFEDSSIVGEIKERVKRELIAIGERTFTGEVELIEMIFKEQTNDRD